MADIVIETFEGFTAAQNNWLVQNKGFTGTRRFIRYKDGYEGYIPGEACATTLPVIGDPWYDLYNTEESVHPIYATYDSYADEQEFNARCVSLKLDNVALSQYGVIEYLSAEYSSAADIFDSRDFVMRMGGEAFAISDDANNPVWVWNTHGGNVNQPIYARTGLGSLTIPVQVSTYTTYMATATALLGKLNTTDYSTETPEHPAFAGFKAGQLLFNGISEGAKAVDAEGNIKYQLSLEFAYRSVGKNGDDWLYLYNKATAAWDKPKNGTQYLYDKADFAGLFT